jgi:hypothetical protein
MGLTLYAKMTSLLSTSRSLYRPLAASRNAPLPLQVSFIQFSVPSKGLIRLKNSTYRHVYLFNAIDVDNRQNVHNYKIIQNDFREKVERDVNENALLLSFFLYHIFLTTHSGSILLGFLFRRDQSSTNSQQITSQVNTTIQKWPNQSQLFYGS